MIDHRVLYKDRNEADSAVPTDKPEWRRSDRHGTVAGAASSDGLALARCTILPHATARSPGYFGVSLGATSWEQKVTER